MKLFRLVILLPLLFFCGHLFAANPSYKNFDANFFTLQPDGTTITLVPGIFQGSTSGIPVFNGVGTNTTIRGGAAMVNLSGSTNLYVVPQTLYVRTNGNNATAVRGDPSLAWSAPTAAAAAASPGDTIQLLGGMFSPGTNYFTNLVIRGNGGLLVVSNQVANMPAIIASNVWLQDLQVTNASDKDTEVLLGCAYVGLQPTNVGGIFIRNCRFQSTSITARFPFSTLPPGPNTIDIRNSIFEGWSQAFEVWGSYTYIEGCKFTVPHTHSAGENYAIVFTANDHSTNVIQSSVFEALGSTNGGGNVAVQVFEGSWSKFDNCLIRMQGSLLPSSDCAINFSEDNITTLFDNCTFELNPLGQSGPIVPLCRVESTPGPIGTSGKLEFNNCFYWPQTNGVIVDNNNTSVHVTVRGGNLKRSNFSHPELVSWADTVVATNVDVSRVLNTSSNVVLDANNFLLKDSGGQTVVQFGINKILGIGGQIAVDWANRELDDSSTSPALQWELRNLVGQWTANGFADTALTANSLLGADANKALKSLTIGGGLTFDGTTLAATGGGSGIPGTNSVIAFGSAPNTNWSFENVTGLGETNSDNSLVLLSRGVAYATRGFTGASLTLTNGPISTIANGMSNTITFNPSNAMTFAVGSSANPSNILSLTNSLNGLFAHFYAPVDISSFANASRIVLEDSTKTLVSATASGAIPIDADGTATTSSQLQALGMATTNDTRALTLTGPVNMGILNVTNRMTNQILSASALVSADPNKALQSATVGPNLTFSSSALNLNTNITVSTVTATGPGPSYSWTNAAAANGENGWINNAAIFYTNPATGFWWLSTNGIAYSSNALTADWTVIRPNSLIQSNGVNQTLTSISNSYAVLTGVGGRIDLSALNGGGVTNGASLQQTGLANFSSWVDVAGALQSTNGVFLFRRQMGMTNAVAGYSVPLDFSVGNYVYIQTNNNFTVSGFKNYTNGWVNWQTLSYSNSDGSAHVLSWPAGLVQFGTNTGTSVSVPAGKVWKGTFSVDPHGTNLYGATQSN